MNNGKSVEFSIGQIDLARWDTKFWFEKSLVATRLVVRTWYPIGTRRVVESWLPMTGFQWLESSGFIATKIDWTFQSTKSNQVDSSRIILVHPV